MSDSEHLLNTLRNFCDAYPESIFPTPPEDQRAKDAAAADVMREMALPWFKRAADRIDKLEAGLNQILTISYDPYLHSEDEPHGWYLGVSAAQTIAHETLNE